MDKARKENRRLVDSLLCAKFWQVLLRRPVHVVFKVSPSLRRSGFLRWSWGSHPPLQAPQPAAFRSTGAVQTPHEPEASSVAEMQTQLTEGEGPTVKHRSSSCVCPPCPLGGLQPPKQNTKTGGNWNMPEAAEQNNRVGTLMNRAQPGGGQEQALQKGSRGQGRCSWAIRREEGPHRQPLWVASDCER